MQIYNIIFYFSQSLCFKFFLRCNIAYNNKIKSNKYCFCHFFFVTLWKEKLLEHINMGKGKKGGKRMTKKQLSREFEKVGFKDLNVVSLSFGIASIHYGKKPLSLNTRNAFQEKEL